MERGMERWRKALRAGRGGESKYKILVQAIMADIDSGVLADGARLPTQREVSRRLAVSVQTVTNAYQELERHGLIECAVGRGSFVSKRASERVSSYVLDCAEQSLVDFSTARLVHTPEHDMAWQEACARLATQDNQPWMREARPIAGFDYHRAAAVDWLATLGMPASIDTVLITNGVAHAVFLALAALVSPGDVVVTESVTDHGVIGAAQVLGFTLKGLDCDAHGIQPESFEDACANHRVRALVCTPNLNNPTASWMLESRRHAIARIAERYGVYVIEDDVFGPLLPRRRTPISALVPALGLYCTSFTKSVLRGLRTGYLCVPARLTARINGVLRVTSWMATPLLAEVATRWIADGTAERLLAIQRERLGVRQRMVHEVLGDFVIGQHPVALAAWVGIPRRWPLDALVRVLLQQDVAVTSPEPFVVRGTRRPAAIRLCLGAEVADERMYAALESIAAAFADAP